MTGDAAPPPQAPDEGLLAAYVGPRWDSYYRARFAALASAQGWRRFIAWNWAAALAPFWFAYRRRVDLQLAWSILFFPVWLGVIGVFNQDVRSLLDPLGPFLITYVLIGTLQGLAGTGAVYRRARLAIRHADAPEATEVVRKRGGVSSMGPLICLLLLLLAFPGTKMPHSIRYSMYTSLMKSDLRNLVTAMESYFADTVTYPAALPPGYAMSTGFTVEIVQADSHGYSARVRHSFTPATCSIFVGSAAPLVENANEGEPKCQSGDETRRFPWLWRTRPRSH